LNKIYKFSEIASKPIHDFLTALQNYEKLDFTVSAFSNSLSGIQEEIWKYIYLIRKLLAHENQEQLINLVIFRKKIVILYPDRPVYSNLTQEDIYEHMELEFISYCDNDIKKDSLINFVMNMMKKNIEPNVQFVIMQSYAV
jgi:hypothetical protein